MGNEGITPSDARVAISTLGAALVATTLVDTAMVLGTHVIKHHGLTMLILRNGAWLFAPATALTFWAASPLRWRGGVVAIGGITVALVTMKNFRGNWVWPGTFDRYLQPTSSIVVATLVGISVGFVLLWKSPRMPKLLAIPWFVVALVAASSLWVYIEGRTFPFDSLFAPSRHIALAVATVVLSVGALLEEKVGI